MPTLDGAVHDEITVVRSTRVSCGCGHIKEWRWLGAPDTAVIQRWVDRHRNCRPRWWQKKRWKISVGLLLWAASWTMLWFLAGGVAHRASQLDIFLVFSTCSLAADMLYGGLRRLFNIRKPSQ